MQRIWKNFLQFNKKFHTVTLPVLFLFFLYCFIQEIPLLYLLPFLLIYGVSRSLSFFFEEKQIPSRESAKNEYQYPIIIAVNILLLFFSFLFITRYELIEYRFLILASIVIIINSIFLEYQTHMITNSTKRFAHTVLGKWTLRTLALLVLTGTLFAIYNTWSFRDLPPPPVKPRITQSEVTGILSTQAPLEEEVLTGSSESPLTEQTEGKSPAPTTTAVKTPTSLPSREATGSLSTAGNVRIESITSEDGRATATIKDGKLTVIVANPTPVTSTGTEWSINASVKSAQGKGGLHGIVISAPIASPVGSTYPTPQPITLSSEGASGIFFTLDGSEPDCKGKGLTSAKSKEKKITITAISCFGNNRIRGPISRHVYTN